MDTAMKVVPLTKQRHIQQKEITKEDDVSKTNNCHKTSTAMKDGFKTDDKHGKLNFMTVLQ